VTTIRVRGKVRLEKEDFGKRSRIRLAVSHPKQIVIVK
jgi:hypothetical protein